MIKNRIVLSAVVTVYCTSVLFSQQVKKEPQKLELKTKKEKVSYCIGWNIGSSLKREKVDINTTVLSQALRDALTGGIPSLTDEEMKQVMTTFHQELQMKQMETMNKQADKNKKEGDKFLVENRIKPGVKTTPSGLQYKVVQEGKGDKPTADDTVTVHYKGTTIDGKEFDSSYKRGQPATFPLKGVIPGWTEGVQLMSVGSKYEFYIPSKLGYGERGAGESIGPNATLIFIVELISIEKKASTVPDIKE